MKYKKIILSAFIIFVLISVIFLSRHIILANAKNKSEIISQNIENLQNDDSFTQLLDLNHVTINGHDSYLTNIQLKGLIDMVNSKDSNIIEKYKQKLTMDDSKIKLSAPEVLELHYYTISTDKQKNLINDISNNKVDVSIDEKGTILISYNIY
jgi:hypothetical protein